MSVFATSTPALKPRTDASAKISIFYAGLLLVMAVTQLFTFEEFIAYMQTIGLPLNEQVSFAIVPVIILAEVFALPFLLRMRLSMAFRYFSMFLGVLVGVLWFFISFRLASTYSQVDTVGFLGTLVNLAPGWWAVFMSLGFVVLAVWSSWGLWPGKRAAK